MSRLITRSWAPSDAAIYANLPRGDRKPFTYTAFVPDPIEHVDLSLGLSLAEQIGSAEAAVRTLDSTRPELGSIEVLSRLLLRAESVSSSRIEGLRVGHRRLAEALHDPEHSRGVERAVIDNIRALDSAIDLAARSEPLTLDDLLAIHKILVAHEPGAGPGALRTVQNWIGGGETPRLADYVPPPWEDVEWLSRDLVAFCNRTDLPPLLQAAIAHAQFETIHPFIDGNGRVGRCLIHAVLRRRGVVERYVPPISVVLAANASAYVKGLVAFREGNVADWIELFCVATAAAAQQARRLFDELAAIKEEWIDRLGRPRRDASVLRLVEELAGIPILEVGSVAARLGVSLPAANNAIARLEAAGIVRPLREDARRNRRWFAPQIPALLDAFEWEVAARVPELAGTGRGRSAPSPTRGFRQRLHPLGSERSGRAGFGSDGAEDIGPAGLTPSTTG